MAHKNLASERVRVGMTQEQLATELGIATSTLVRYEADTDAIPAPVLASASRLFGCSTDYLLDMTDERTAQ